MIAALKAREQEIRAAGVLSLSLFGSVARGEDSAHNVAVAAHLGQNWAATRKQGRQSASDASLDADVILAAQAADLSEGVATTMANTNVRHLAFVLPGAPLAGNRLKNKKAAPPFAGSAAE